MTPYLWNSFTSSCPAFCTGAGSNHRPLTSSPVSFQFFCNVRLLRCYQKFMRKRSRFQISDFSCLRQLSSEGSQNRADQKSQFHSTILNQGSSYSLFAILNVVEHGHVYNSVGQKLWRHFIRTSLRSYPCSQLLLWNRTYVPDIMFLTTRWIKIIHEICFVLHLNRSA